MTDDTSSYYLACVDQPSPPGTLLTIGQANACPAASPSPSGGFEESWEEAWNDLSRHAREGAAFIAEDDEGPIGYAFARKPEQGRAHLTDLYVRPRARRQGHARALIAAVVESVRPLGADQLTLDVLPSNTAALL